MDSKNDITKKETAREKNEKLLNLQKEWEYKLYMQLSESYAIQRDVKLSRAFSFGVSQHYTNSDKKIMIVGQEAKGHTFDPLWNLEHWHDWAIEYLEFQLYKEPSIHGYKFNKNGSPFWTFIRELIKKREPDEYFNYGVCWNNLDKVTRYIKEDGKEWKEHKLPYDKQNNIERAILNKKIFDDNSKSLLKKEIEVSNPDILIFAVGASNPYYHTLYTSILDIDGDYNTIFNKLKCPYPQKDHECVDITEIANLGVPTYYTYHPNFLQQSNTIKKVVDKIKGVIK